MTFEEYQKKARETAIYPEIGKNYIYPTLGLLGEAGEVSEKIKKIIRDKNGILSDEIKKDLNKELGDVLWYLANLSAELNIPLETIAIENIKKLEDRKNRNVLRGDGDNR